MKVSGEDQGSLEPLKPVGAQYAAAVQVASPAEFRKGIRWGVLTPRAPLTLAFDKTRSGYRY